MTITRAEIEAAVWGATRAEARSDFDLTPNLRPRTDRRRPAAVLCPIVERDDGFHVILTRRADHLNQHAGQIAFPAERSTSTTRRRLRRRFARRRRRSG